MTTDRLRPSNFRYRLAPCSYGKRAGALGVTDPVPRSRFGGSRTKNKGRGEENGERRKRDLAKYDCVGQNLAHASTAHALNLTCSSCVQ